MKHSLCRMALWSLILTSGFLWGCKDDTSSGGVSHDPSKPIEITDFEPKEGGARTRLYIYGKNFGTDLSQINVKIGGLPSKVIGCNGEIIYCMVPFKASEGSIEVCVGPDSVSAVAAEKFNYQSKTLVTTLAGYVDETGKVEVKDGSFEEAGFSGPTWMAIDPKDKNRIFVVDGSKLVGTSIREMNLKERTVSTLLTRGQGNWEAIRSLAFSPQGDTLFIVNQQDSETAIAVSYTTRKNGFKKPQPLILTRRATSCFMHPNGEIYYNNRASGQVFRYDPVTQESTPLYKIGTTDMVVWMIMHPSGNYVYFVCSNWRVILKAEYDWENKTLKNYNVFCGQQGAAGWVDGQGTNARLHNPCQGCFVKNEQYIKEGKEDIYDFYFCDSEADAIRYVTPEGFVHTYAGRGSQGADHNSFGYVDGDLREEARFNYPAGIYYDDENKIFYIGDADNYRIRNIMKDE